MSPRPPTAAEPATGLRSDIAAVLHQIADAEDFDTAARALLEVLGYPTGLTLRGQTGSVDDFIHLHDAPHPGTNTEQALRRENPTIKLLCQVTDDSLDLLGHQTLIEQHDIEQHDIRSFLFVTADLKRCTYQLTDYTQHTREINKRFRMPTVVLYRTAAAALTVAFADRRRDKRDSGRDVLGKVSLIRDINMFHPHPAHLRLLEQLSIRGTRAWMKLHDHAPNFDALHTAWLTALDTDVLNKNFYRRLFDWFQRAVDEAAFPTGDGGDTQQEVQVIRLITRLLFIWFMKEKRLVAPELFAQEQAEILLRDYDPHNGDSYYRAILQNLFFATLNTEYDQPDSRRSLSHYLYHDEISQPDVLLDLFDRTPFINGGLFDCLDRAPTGTDDGDLADCYTDNPQHRHLLSVPNRLFFDRDGIITLLDSYKFTLEENTPIDQDVALDPELLGKVFENLLAAHNPVTRKPVRKLTGSYYTPRVIVDYMADEALIAYLAANSRPAYGDHRSWIRRLRRLFDYEATKTTFEPAEAESIIRSIANVKVLDPAVGSGAFPMAVLHKLTLALRVLDPENDLWAAHQKEIALNRTRGAYNHQSQEDRDAELKEISGTFQRYQGSDFGRKLYLIQNAIYGVDIQPIACQIAKLRFFISLAIEQQPNPSAENRGIKPLPNLETKFVAADTLRGVRGPRGLTPEHVDRIEKRMRRNREQHFNASTHEYKKALRAEYLQLRADLVAELRQLGMPLDATSRIARWDPDDQNDKADWFDPEYMFGVDSDFDIVISNPPYVVVKDRQLRRTYKEGVFGRMNLYGLFLQRGLQLTNLQGQLLYIVPKTLLADNYFKNLRKVLTHSSDLKGVVLITDRHNTFDSVLQECIIVHLTPNTTTSSPPVAIRQITKPGDLLDLDSSYLAEPNRVRLGPRYDYAYYCGTSDFDYEIFERITADTVELAHYHLKAITGKIQFDKYRRYARPVATSDTYPLIWAENIQRFTLRQSKMRIGKEWLDKRLGKHQQLITEPVIVIQRTTASEQPRRIIATLLSPQDYNSCGVYLENHTSSIAVSAATMSPSCLLGLLNSSITEYVFRKLNSNTQVSAGELNALPFPKAINPTVGQQIEQLVQELRAIGGVDCPVPDRPLAVGYERELDVLVGSLYGLAPEDVEHIQTCLPAYETVYGSG